MVVVGSSTLAPWIQLLYRGFNRAPTSPLLGVSWIYSCTYLLMIVYKEFLMNFSCSENVWNCSTEVVYFVNCGKWKSVQSVAMEQANLAYQSSTPCGTCCSLYSTHGCSHASPCSRGNGLFRVWCDRGPFGTYTHK